jgi:hypothetical protein
MDQNDLPFQTLEGQVRQVQKFQKKMKDLEDVWENAQDGPNDKDC